MAWITSRNKRQEITIIQEKGTVVIGMILQAKIPPPDLRVEKEVKTLIAGGHEVHLLLERAPGQEVHDTMYGARFHRLVEMSPMREKWHRYTFNFTYRDSVWREAIDRFVGRSGVEALHVHDLPLVREGVEAGRRAGIPVIADLHENYPDGLQVWYTSGLKKSTIYNLQRWKRYERQVLQEVDAVIAVVDESKERIRKLGIPAERIYVVPNTASRERENIPLDPAIQALYKGRFVISYIGGFASHRGLDTSIRAMSMVRERVPQALLLLIGDRNKPYMQYLKGLAGELGVADMVEMPGYQPFDKIWSYIDASDICLVPHARNAHTDTTIPHKIFQYMMVGKPVIVSDCPPLKRYIEASGGGLVFKWDDPSDLAARIIEISENESLAAKISKVGREAFLEKYNWESTSSELIELYRGLAAGKLRNE
jgi:glycosyltransferase involved in cell wall biosynthesis